MSKVILKNTRACTMNGMKFNIGSGKIGLIGSPISGIVWT